MSSPAAPQWELSKENVQPLKRGRHADALGASACASASNKSFNEQRCSFRKEVAEYVGDDPLTVWLRFISWTRLNFPQGGRHSQLLELLEECTRALLPVQRYKTDIRYLRVWLQYADCCTEPKEVLDFMELHGIGQEFALYYEARAAFLELRGNFQKAQLAYEAGLLRHAQPFERLKTKFASFKARMASREAARIDALTLGIADTLARPTSEHRQMTSTSLATGMLAGNPMGLTGTSRDAGFSIFEDDVGDSTPIDFQPAPSQWAMLSTQTGSVKENAQAPSQWNAARGLPLAPSRSACQVFQVFDDSECQTVHGDQERAKHAAQKQYPPSARSVAGAAEKNYAQLPSSSCQDAERSFEELRALVWQTRLCSTQPREVCKPLAARGQSAIEIGTFRTGSGLHAAEATMTINLRDAYNDINQLFMS